MRLPGPAPSAAGAPPPAAAGDAATTGAGGVNTAAPMTSGVKVEVSYTTPGGVSGSAVVKLIAVDIQSPSY